MMLRRTLHSSRFATPKAPVSVGSVATPHSIPTLYPSFFKPLKSKNASHPNFSFEVRLGVWLLGILLAGTLLSGPAWGQEMAVVGPKTVPIPGTEESMPIDRAFEEKQALLELEQKKDALQSLRKRNQSRVLGRQEEGLSEALGLIRDIQQTMPFFAAPKPGNGGARPDAEGVEVDAPEPNRAHFFKAGQPPVSNPREALDAIRPQVGNPDVGFLERPSALTEAGPEKVKDTLEEIRQQFQGTERPGPHLDQEGVPPLVLNAGQTEYREDLPKKKKDELDNLLSIPDAPRPHFFRSGQPVTVAGR